METFQDYKVAELSTEIKDKIEKLEQKLATETNQNIVLIASQKKN